MSQRLRYVSLARLRLAGELYRVGDIIPGLDAETAEPLIAAGWVVEGVTEVPGNAQADSSGGDADGEHAPAASKPKKGKGGQ